VDRAGGISRGIHAAKLVYHFSHPVRSGFD
jgi:hypothetical protein